MKFDFTGIPFFDNHTHLLNTTRREISLKEFMGPLNHGYVDQIPKYSYFKPNDHAGDNNPLWISDDMLLYNTCNMGIARTWVHYLSQFYGCEETPEAVLAERNQRSMKDMQAYTQELYRDQNIIAEVVDEPYPMGDPIMNCFPCSVYRLYQTDPIIFRYINECESYKELLDRFDADLHKAFLVDGYVGVKCHVLEVNRMPPHYVGAAEAEAVFRKAKNGDEPAKETIYMAAFCHMLILSQEINFPVHLHTGLTGKVPYKDVRNCDPLCFAELLGDTRFVGSHLVFLHAGYPFVRNASVMAQTYPHVWIDFAQVVPWEAINFPSILEDVMGFASCAKLTFGSGAHGHPELNWMAAKVAKKSLAVVLDRAVERDFISHAQAKEIAELMLYKNLMRLYKLS